MTTIHDQGGMSAEAEYADRRCVSITGVRENRCSASDVSGPSFRRLVAITKKIATNRI